MTDIVERLRKLGGDGSTGYGMPIASEAADRIAELERELAAETNNKQEFERDWLACCDMLNDERRVHLELEETLVEKLEAAQAREKVLRDALFELANLHVVVHSQSPEGRVYMKKLGDLMASSDDTALKAAIQHGIAEFLERTGQYVTNDASRKAALKAERERCRLHDAADVATKAMRKAWQLGQTYWQQADSESYRQNAKSAITQDTFNDLLDSTAEAIRALEDK